MYQDSLMSMDITNRHIYTIKQIMEHYAFIQMNMMKKQMNIYLTLKFHHIIQQESII